MTPTFVGRRGELDVLLALGHQVRSRGGTTVALVTGDPGIGKTRLVDEALARLDLPYVLRMVGFQPEREVPLAAADPLLRALGETDRRRAAAPGDDLARVLERAYAGLRTRQPAALVVDDLQWVDAASLALCHHLVRAAASSGLRVAVLVAARTGAAPEVLTSLTRLVPEPSRAHLRLAPLDAHDGVRLVLATNPGLDRDRATQLWERGGGSPFWLRVLAEVGTTAAEQDLADLLGGLDPSAAEVLEILAVLDRPVTGTELAALLGEDGMTVGAAAGDLVRRGVVADAAGVLRLTHDLVRSAVTGRLPPARRRDLHRRIAGWLQDTADGELSQLVEALLHRQAGGLDAVDLALQVAGSPHRRLLGTESLRRLESVADRAGTDDSRAVRLQLELAALASGLGDYETALQRCGAVLDQSQEAPERAAAALRAAKAAYELRRPAQALGFLRRARAAGGDEAWVAVDADVLESAVLRWVGHRSEDARALADRALAAARQCAQAPGADGPDGRGRRAYLVALSAAFDTATYDGRAEDMLALAEETVAVARDLDERAYLRGLVECGTACWFLGDLHEAERRSRLALAESHRRGVPKTRMHAGYWLAAALVDLGRLREAQDEVAAATELQHRLGDLSPTFPRLARLQAHLSWHAVDRSRGVELLTANVAADSDPHFRLTARLMLVTDLTRTGEDLGGPSAATVTGQIEAARSDAERAGCRRCLGLVLVGCAEAWARLGETTTARAWLDARVPLRLPDNRRTALDVQRAEAVLALAEGADDAVTRLAEVVAAAETGGFGTEELWARIDLARAALPRDVDLAVTELARVAAQAHRTGAVTAGRLAERTLRSLGVRPRGPAWGGPSPVEGLEALTPAERVVASLVAGGATNPEIAAALFLSRRTVERHLSAAFTRLGVRNRTELAALVRDSGAHLADLTHDGAASPFLPSH